MELCHGGFCACTGVVFGAAQVRVTVEEYRRVVVGVQRIFGSIRVPAENVGNLSACGQPCSEERCLHASVKVQAEFVQREVAVFGLDGTAFGDVETFGECAWTVEVTIGVLVIKEHPVPLPGDS